MENKSISGFTLPVVKTTLYQAEITFKNYFFRLSDSSFSISTGYDSDDSDSFLAEVGYFPL